jgi:hypothetical protein
MQRRVILTKNNKTPAGKPPEIWFSLAFLLAELKLHIIKISGDCSFCFTGTTTRTDSH